LRFTTVTKLFPLVFLAALTACDEGVQISEEEAVTYGAAFEQATMTMTIQEKWSRSCALCHVGGEGGAPRMGDADAWRDRIAAGRAAMLKHTIEGRNRMPPLGYCMDCELEDFAAIIVMMAGDQ
jgi:cytochrome c5